MRFIEKSFPVEYLNPVAKAEGNAKKPVYRMHKWWARRLGSVFRTIVLSVFADENESEHSIWQKFCDGASLEGKVVLDPFMGGGTTIVEALRLGCKVIGVDINPVAWFVTKKEVEPVDIDALDAAFRRLERTVGERIKSYYRTICLNGHHADAMYFFWVKVAECEKCGAKVRLFPNYELAQYDHKYIILCPNCLQIITTDRYNPVTSCPDCGFTFDPKKGVSRKGLFRCPECGTEQKVLDAIRRRGRALDVELYALEGYCEICGRFFKRVDAEDIALFQQAKAEFERRKEHLFFPRQPIPMDGRSDPRPVNHGYTYFWQMFNERQLLCLSMLLEEILKLPDPNIRELMLIAFSDCLDANNMFCKYEVRWHKISLFFGLHAYHPIERPTENNVWGTVFGRGTFTRCFEKVRRAKVYCKKPYERLPNIYGKRYSKPVDGETIEGTLVQTYEELVRTDHSVLLRCQNSEDLSFLPDKSVDAVITDPPYFDNVQYSELSDFFYVWLRLALEDAYEWFKPEFSERPGEIVKNRQKGKTTDFFKESLQRVFAECHRVLKDDGMLVFTFHHNKIWAWESIAEILLNAGFYISATPVVRSEGKSGFHSSRGNIRYDCVLVCRKKPAPLAPWGTPSIKGRILDDAVMWTRRTLQSGMPVNYVDVFTIVMGKTLEHYTKAVAGGNKNIKPLGELLREMEELVEYVDEKAGAEAFDIPAPYARQVKQLALFVMESKAAFR
ncbi:MAG TPA: DUF1156 domain-containing protein [Deltaproteobacteria bacterium]|nr:DUF1156 domain-containing protein [Deltaproteobacteria bacterium]